MTLSQSQTGAKHSADAPLGNWDVELDAMGLLCPLPVLKARKRLGEMQSGQVLRVLATDPAAVIDMPHFCTQSGHEFLGCAAFDPPAQTHLPAATAYFIRRL